MYLSYKQYFMSKLFDNISETEKEQILEQHARRKKKEEVTVKSEKVITRTAVFLANCPLEEVQDALSKLSPTIKFLTIINCGGADFTNYDLCNKYTNLFMISLKGTPNNFDKLYGNCFRIVGDELYERKTF